MVCLLLIDRTDSNEVVPVIKLGNTDSSTDRIRVPGQAE